MLTVPVWIHIVKLVTLVVGKYLMQSYSKSRDTRLQAQKKAKQEISMADSLGHQAPSMIYNASYQC
jgi:hypothetical protein